MTPPEPPDAVMSVEPQNVPPPEPVTGPGATLTVITPEVVHPAAVVYIMVVVPLDKLVKEPVLLIVPTAVLLLLQEPPAGVLLSVAVEPTHIAAMPVMEVGFGFMVTVTAASGPQHPNDDCTLK